MSRYCGFICRPKTDPSEVMGDSEIGGEFS